MAMDSLRGSIMMLIWVDLFYILVARGTFNHTISIIIVYHRALWYSFRNYFPYITQTVNVFVIEVRYLPPCSVHKVCHTHSP